MAVNSDIRRSREVVAIERSGERRPHLVSVPPSSQVGGRDRGVVSARPNRVRQWLMLADAVALLVGVALAFGVQSVVAPVDVNIAATQWALLLASLPMWFVAANVNQLYVSRANQNSMEELRNLIFTCAVGVGALVGLAFVFQIEELPRRWVSILAAVILLTVFVERRIARTVFVKLRRSGRLSRPILIVGTDSNASAMVNGLQAHPGFGYTAVGFVGDEAPIDSCDIPVLGGLDDIEAIAAVSGVTGVMISLYSVDGPTVNALSRRLTDAGLHVTLCSSLVDIDPRRLRVQSLDGRAMIYIEPTIRTGWRHWAMRAFDFTVAVVGLALTGPILLAAAVAIRLESPGPILFRQKRIGKLGQPFEILKLRTMHDGADALKGDLLDLNESDGPLFKMRSDPRITRVGRVLRKFSIDELPQFWNVIRGEMSVVGPRPALPTEVAEWDPDVHERLRVLPGITGMWQVSGRSDTTFEQYKRLDLYYVENWSLMHDLRIVFKTVGVVFRGRGAS